MQVILGYPVLPPLSIWTGPWMGRAGMLAEMCSFVFLAPEFLGPERLKGVEDALRKGLTSSLVRWASIGAYFVVFIAFFALGGLGLFEAQRVFPPLSYSAHFPSWAYLAQMAVVVLMMFSNSQCDSVVEDRQIHAADSDALFGEHSRLGRVARSVVNPLEFQETAKPPLWLWLLWFVGIPVHVFMFVVFFVIPDVVLGGLHLEQRLLASGIGLRTLVLSAGVVLFFGGMAAQFIATF